MAVEITSGKPTTRRYTPAEKEQAVRLVRALRAGLGTEHGTVQRIATQLGYGVESVRSWVIQSDIDDGHAPGVTTVEARRIVELEQENLELRRANEILKRAASFFGADRGRQHTRSSRVYRREPRRLRGRADHRCSRGSGSDDRPER